MPRPRYVLGTVTGYGRHGANTGRDVGLSVHVLDSLVLYGVVGSFRSDDRTFRRDPSGRILRGSQGLGFEGATAAGKALADRLNAEHEAWLREDA